MRITGCDWIAGGITPEEAGLCARELREIGFDYVCVSSGGIAPQARAPLAPGYQVPFAAAVKKASAAAVQAVGMIVDPRQAEAIVAEGCADCVALARAFLDDPRWAWHAADALGAAIVCPPQYRRARPDLWPGAALAHPHRTLGYRLDAARATRARHGPLGQTGWGHRCGKDRSKHHGPCWIRAESNVADPDLPR